MSDAEVENSDPTEGTNLTWEKMLELSNGAAEAEIKTGREITLMCGALIWMDVLEIVSERLGEQAIADCFEIDTMYWRPSFIVPHNQVMAVKTVDTVMRVPLGK